VQGYQYSMLGLSFDIVGAFLVAVEAIKLENVRAFRDRVLKKMQEYTLSPRITVVNTGESLALVKPSVPADRYPGFFMGLHYLAGFILVEVANELVGGQINRVLLHGALWALERPWYVAIVATLGFGLFGIILGLWMLGEFVHVALTKSMHACIMALDFIDSRTPDGTVGVLGYLALLIGFLLQMYGSYLGGHRV